MEKDLLEIIDNYGVLPQLKYFQSEIFELNEAIINYEYDCCEYEEVERELKSYILGELADVTVMLKQFQVYYGITDEEIENIMKEKIERTKKRMEENYYD